MTIRIKNRFFSLVLFTTSVFADFDYTVNNSNFTVSNKNYMYNYNRLRFRGDYTQDKFFASVIADGVNYLGSKYTNSTTFDYIKSVSSDTPFKTQSNFHDYDNGEIYSKLYRLYGGYEDNENKVVVGLQNISMGVGRIWTPTNLYNPRNIYAIEPDEVFGVMAISYTRHLNETSHLTIVSSQKEDNSFKYGARYKAFLSVADFAVNIVHSNDTDMIGYELEGNLFDSGVELRSEGAYIQNNLEDAFFQGILGADYGFENGVTLVVEALYSSKKFSKNEILQNLDSEIVANLQSSTLYTATYISYSFNLLLDSSLTYIESFNEKNSRYISPTLTYTLNDYNSFMLGAMLYDGDNNYYFKWSLSF